MATAPISARAKRSGENASVAATSVPITTGTAAAVSENGRVAKNQRRSRSVIRDLPPVPLPEGGGCQQWPPIPARPAGASHRREPGERRRRGAPSLQGGGRG